MANKTDGASDPISTVPKFGMPASLYTTGHYPCRETHFILKPIMAVLLAAVTQATHIAHNWSNLIWIGLHLNVKSVLSFRIFHQPNNSTLLWRTHNLCMDAAVSQSLQRLIL